VQSKGATVSNSEVGIFSVPDIRQARNQGYIVDNPQYDVDYRTVVAFGELKGRPSRPFDQEVVVRSTADFETIRGRLPMEFFEPFNELLRYLRLSPLIVEPNMAAINTWNDKDFSARMIQGVVGALQDHRIPALVPMLVSVFLNLEQTKAPPNNQWDLIDLITVPGSRSFDRPAEAFRAYLNAGGVPKIATFGKAPYYDDTNSGIEVTEAEAMSAFLRLLGVPKEKLYRETESNDTVENASFLLRVLDEIDFNRDGISRILLVSSPFHLARYRLNVEMELASANLQYEIYAIGSRASRYWAETYFISDSKTGYTRESMLNIVFNEYLKIAFDLCAQRRTIEIKKDSIR
jgi:uncharacterized SAM-binding protein YcdF (DUF218 family)